MSLEDNKSPRHSDEVFYIYPLKDFACGYMNDSRFARVGHFCVYPLLEDELNITLGPF